MASGSSLRTAWCAKRFLAALGMLAAIAPLLGLLGTVTGMIDTFQVITRHGDHGHGRLPTGRGQKRLAGRQSADLLMLKADLFYALRDFGKAQAVYHRVAEQKGPRAARAWLMAGYAAWQQNDLEAGRDAFQAAAKDRHHRKSALLALRQMKRDAP